jgi:prepilin peptidase CpaA
MAVEQWSAIAVALMACVTDLRTRRIPNMLTFSAAVGALGYHAFGGWIGLAGSIGGLLLGLALFLPIYLLRGMGAGDVKLLAALGAWLGPASVAWVAIYAAIAGGIMAVAVALGAGYLRPMLANVWLLLTHWRVSGVKPLDSVTLDGGRGPRLAYAVPIAAGLLCAILLG